MDVPKPALDEITAVYEAGLYLTAWRKAQALGPLRDWAPPASTLAGRMAMNLGGERLGLYLHLRGRRRNQDDPEALYYWARAMYSRRGPLVAFRLLEKLALPGSAPAPLAADWFSLKATVAAAFRDFEQAERWFAQAESLDPRNAWIGVERSAVLAMQDRYDEALGAAQRSLELRPWYRPAVQSVSEQLLQLGRLEEALELVRQADEKLECAGIAEQRAMIESALLLFEEAARSLERCAALSPLLEEAGQRRLAARRVDVLCELGDRQRAIEEARRAKNPYHDEIAKRLLERGDAPRRRLRVPFVRQRHLTCSPASFASITSFWEKPIDHLALASAITYDGTPGFKEREWAETNGWAIREFKVTWDAAISLLERGLPFTLVTVGVDNAHEQVVMGYDSARGVFLIRDPGGPFAGQFLAEPLLEDQQVVGPRGLVAVPSDKAALLQDLALPEAALYDHAHRLDVALQRNDRETAQAALAALQREAPESVVTVRAVRTLASYDADDLALSASAELLHRRFPETAQASQARLSSLRRAGRREECLEILRARCDAPDAHPFFWREYAEALAVDAREQDRALRMLERGVRYYPTHPGLLVALAHALWRRHQKPAATTLYRLAACLDDLNEDLATSYFIACRHLRRTEEGLAFLGQRVDRLGARSPRPVQTHFWALQQLDRGDEAFAALERALERHADDGDLLCQAADAYARYGNPSRAEALLQAAQGVARPVVLLRSEAALAGYRGDTLDALGRWRAIVEHEPLAVDAHREVARLVASAEGPAAAQAYAEAAVARLPHHHGMAHLWYEWARDAGFEAASRALEHLVALNPGDPWARRERALLLSAQRRLEEAAIEAAEGVRLDPEGSASHSVRGVVFAASGKDQEAIEAFREALRRDADNASALTSLMDLAIAPDEARRQLGFVREQLKERMAFGDALFAYRGQGRIHLSPDELLRDLRELQGARPDLWQTWSTLTNQLVDMNRLEEASQAAQASVEEFPLLPGLWLDLARVRGLRGDAAGERDAAEEAVAVGPQWGPALRWLARTHRENKDTARARTLLEQAVARAPLDPLNHGTLAELLWTLGEREAALARVERALALDPGYDWAWGALLDWCETLTRRDRAISMARELTQGRGGEARSWMVLARMLRRPDDLDERLAALERASFLEPRLVEAHDLRAELLAGAGRFEDALQACRPPAFGAVPTRELRGRAAWVAAMRGERGTAIRMMNELLVEEPRYHWGVSRLADWHAEAEDWPAYLKAADRLVELAPHHAVSLGYRGDARLKTGDLVGAKTDLRRATELDPEYTFARRELVNMLFDEKDLSAVAAILESSVDVPGDDSLRAQRIRLFAAQKARDKGVACLGEWLADPALDPGWLELGLREMSGAGWQDSIDEAVTRALAAGPCHVGLARAWIAGFAALDKFESCRERLRDVIGHEALLVPALTLYLESVGRARLQKPIERILAEHRELVTRDATLWGTLGYTYVALGDNSLARRWLGDWQRREGVRPWMLHNLVLALTREKEWDQAQAVSRAALGLPPDHTTNGHHAWLLAEQALLPDLHPAEDSLRAIESATLDDRFEFLRSLARGVIGLRRGRIGFAAFQAHVKAAEQAMAGFANEPELRHVYVRSVWRAARGQPGVGPTLWALVRCWRAERPAALASLIRLAKEKPLAPTPPAADLTARKRRVADAEG